MLQQKEGYERQKYFFFIHIKLFPFESKGAHTCIYLPEPENLLLALLKHLTLCWSETRLGARGV